MLSLLLSIFIPIILVGGLAICSFIMWGQHNKTDGAVKGTLLFNLDIASRKIKLLNRDSTRIQNRYVYDHKYTDDWLPLKTIKGNFKGTVGEKEFRNALVKATKQEQVKFSFVTSKVIKNEKILFSFTITKIHNVDEHILAVSWDVVDKTIEFDVERLDYTKSQIADQPALYKGFIGFALDSRIPNVQSIFSRDIGKIFRFKQIQISFAKGLAVVPFFEKDRKTAERRMKKFIKVIRNRGYRLGINRLTFGSAQLLSKDVTTPKRVNTILKTLDFLVNLSIRYKEDFITKETKHFNKEEYFAFVEAAQVFRLAIRSGDIKSVPLAVRKYSSKRKVIEYVVPTVTDVSTEILTSILRNHYNRSQLINAQAKKISIEKKIDRPSLFDVNVTWLMQNKSRINLKKAIYVLNFPGVVKPEYIDTIIELKQKGFIFAIRLKAYSEQVSTMIMRIKPQFIVVDKELSSTAAPSSYIQLVSIKNISDYENVKLIYENPSHDIDPKWAERIGLEFYYEF